MNLKRQLPTQKRSLPWKVFPTLLLTVFSVTGFAQESIDSTLQVTRASGIAALQHLRDGETGKALESLGAAADAIKNVHPKEDEGITAAAGGLFRALHQLDEGEQFDLLYKWTMPTESRKTVRILTSAERASQSVRPTHR